MTIDLSSYTPKGDKENSDFFKEYLPRIYERRAAAGLTPSTNPHTPPTRRLSQRR